MSSSSMNGAVAPRAAVVAGKSRHTRAGTPSYNCHSLSPPSLSLPLSLSLSHPLSLSLSPSLSLSLPLPLPL
jgi:hypothetical protein